MHPNAQIWRCGLRALLIAIKVAYLPVHSKYQIPLRHEDQKLPRAEECRKHISFLAADKRDVKQTLGRWLSKAMRPYRMLPAFILSLLLIHSLIASRFCSPVCLLQRESDQPVQTESQVDCKPLSSLINIEGTG